MPELIIRQSKTKLTFIILGSIAFVVGSIWMWLIADGQTRHSPLFLKGVAIVGACFFSLCFVFGCVKLFDGRPGLIVDDEGIVDNSSAVSAGKRILWDDVIGLRVTEVAKQRFVTIDLFEPEKYVKQRNFIFRMLNAANTKMTGSPINISSNSLDVDSDELWYLLNEGFKEAIRRRSSE
jgi:hypothetical protein